MNSGSSEFDGSDSVLPEMVERRPAGNRQVAAGGGKDGRPLAGDAREHLAQRALVGGRKQAIQ